ncbi:MAG: aspartate aminotransferase family protein [bacterium]|nr:aspartate aminotransferase family protein [bacterium]
MQMVDAELKVPEISEKEKTEIVARFSRYINKGQVKYLKAGHLDVLETEREYIRFRDPVTGKEMIDCFTSAGCFNVGRRNPVVLRALKEALKELDMGSHSLVSKQKVALAKKLVSIAPGDLNRVVLASGGGDAIDCAIKMARGATGRKDVIATIKAYHGHTGFAISANGKEHYRKYFEPLMPGFRFVPYNDLEAVRKIATKETAAIIVEPIQGEAGIFVGDDSYLEGLRRLADELGIILIFDEVQTGFGRTGRFFACEHSGVVPDILALAKSIGGGMFPNGAVLYREKTPLFTFIGKNPNFHPSCSGGSDIGCYVSLRVIEYIEEKKLVENSERSGARFKKALEEIMKENPGIIKEVRGRGLMVGIEYLHEFMGPMMSDALAKNGVFAAYSGNAPQVMRFMLPIVATEDDVDLVVNSIRKAVLSMKALLPLALPAAKIPGVLKLLNNERIQTALFNWIRSLEDLVKKMGRSKKKGQENESK